MSRRPPSATRSSRGSPATPRACCASSTEPACCRPPTSTWPASSARLATRRRSGAAGRRPGRARAPSRPRAGRPGLDPRHGGGRRRRAGRPRRAAVARAGPVRGSRLGWSRPSALVAVGRRPDDRHGRGRCGWSATLAVPGPLLGRGASRSPAPCWPMAPRAGRRGRSSAAAEPGSAGCSGRRRRRAAHRRGRGGAPAVRGRGRRPGHRQDDHRGADRRAAVRAGAGRGARSPLIALAAPTGKAAARLQEAVQAQAAALASTRRSAPGCSSSRPPRCTGCWAGAREQQPVPPRPRPAAPPRCGDRRRDLDGLAVADGAADRGAARRRPAGAGRRSRAAGLDRGRRGAGRHRRPAAAGRGAARALRRTGPLAASARRIVVLESRRAPLRRRDRRAGRGRSGTARPTRVLELLADPTRRRPLDRGRRPPTRPPLAPVRERCARGRARGHRGGRAGRCPAGAAGALGRFRILCAHRRGPYGVASWTAHLEGWLADAVAGFASDERWYVGRPLLVTENDYELRLYNGDTGVVVAQRRAGGGRLRARR